MARRAAGDGDGLGTAVDGELERNAHVGLEVFATSWGVGGLASSSKAAAESATAEELREDISEVREDVFRAIEAARATDAGVAELIVALAFFIIAEHAIGFRGRSEERRGAKT